MFTPNLFTVHEPSGHYGLHRFKDGVLVLAKQHACGDWITIKPPTKEEVAYFEAHGTKAEAK